VPTSFSEQFYLKQAAHVTATRTPKEQKSFASFLQKRRLFLTAQAAETEQLQMLRNRVRKAKPRRHKGHEGFTKETSCTPS
jgi:hypothetical protein